MNHKTAQFAAELEGRLEEFDAKWSQGNTPNIEDFVRLPDSEHVDAEQHRRLLAELVMIDQEYRWRLASNQAEVAGPGVDVALKPEFPARPTLEDYLKQHPLLASQGQIPPQLIANEYRIRQLWGDQPAASTFLDRFEHGSRGLPEELNRVDQQLRDLRGSHGVHTRCPRCRHRIELTQTKLIDVRCPSCGSCFDIVGPNDSAVGDIGTKRLGHFELLEQIGVGSFGTVWRARDTELDRVVAIKIPRCGQLAPDEVERFLREAQTAAQLQHPNIVAVHEVGRADHTVYIASEFVEGMTLATYLNGHVFTAAEAVQLCVTVASALHHAHEAGVVHRDLKPANIILDAGLQPHIMDFGLAKSDASKITMTMDGRLLGTPAFMSPEQAKGHAQQADRRSDIYSLAVILFQLLTDELPFRGETQTVLHKVIHEEAPSPRRLNPNISRDLETICLKCLQKEPAARYDTAATLAADLRRFLLGQPVRARPISHAAHTWRWCQRNPLPAFLAAALFLAIVAGFAGVTSLWIQAVAESQRADDARKSAEDEAELRRRQQYLSDIVVAHEAWMANDVDRCLELLEQYRSQRDGQEDLRRFEWYYLWKLCEPSLTTPTFRLDRLASSVAFAPDGTLAAAGDRTLQIRKPTNFDQPKLIENVHMFPVSGLAFRPPDYRTLATCSLDETLKLWSPGENDTPYVLFDVGDADKRRDYFYGLSFSPDGQLLAANHPEQNAFLLWNVDERELAGTFEVIGQDGSPVHINNVLFSPCGDYLALACGDWMVRLWNVATHQQEDLWPHDKGVRGLAFSPDGTLLASTGDDCLVKVGDVRTREVRARIEGHTKRVFAVTFSPNGKMLATGSDDLTVRLWNVKTQQPLRVFKGHSGQIKGVAFSPDGKILASAGWDGRVWLWDPLTPPTPDTIPGRFVAFSGETLVSWTDWNFEDLRLWQTATCSPITLPIHSRARGPKALSSNGRLLAIGTSDGDVEIWDKETQEPRILSAHNDAIEYVTFSPGGGLLTSASRGELKLWDVASLRPIGRFDAFIGANSVSTKRYTFSIATDGNTLAYAKETKTGDFVIELWDIQSGESLRILPLHTPATSVAFSGDGTLLAIGDISGMAKVWNVRKQHASLESFRAHSTPVFALAFSPDGTRLASGATDAIKLWDVPSGNHVITLRGHADRITSLAFSPNGETLASAGSNDMTVKLRRAAARDDVTVTELSAHAAPSTRRVHD